MGQGFLFAGLGLVLPTLTVLLATDRIDVPSNWFIHPDPDKASNSSRGAGIAGTLILGSIWLAIGVRLLLKHSAS